MQARPLLNEGKTEALVDPRIIAGGGGGYDAEQAKRLAFVAALCIRASATWRPAMTEVRAKRCRSHTPCSSRRRREACPFP
jgi:hypothetical protein